jgi:hypothetical protein
MPTPQVLGHLAALATLGAAARQAWLSLFTAGCRHRQVLVILRLWIRWEWMRGGPGRCGLDRRQHGIAALVPGLSL